MKNMINKIWFKIVNCVNTIVICKFRKHNSISNFKYYLNMCSDEIFDIYLDKTRATLSKKTIEELNNLKIVDLFNETKYENVIISDIPSNNIIPIDFISNFDNSPGIQIELEKKYQEYTFLFPVSSGVKIISEYLKYDKIFNNKDYEVSFINKDIRIVYKNWSRNDIRTIKSNIKQILNNFTDRVTNVTNSVNNFNNFEVNINHYIKTRIIELKTKLKDNNQWNTGW